MVQVLEVLVVAVLAQADSGTNGSGNSASTSGSTILTATELQMLFGTMDTALLTKVK